LVEDAGSLDLPAFSVEIAGRGRWKVWPISDAREMEKGAGKGIGWNLEFELFEI